MGWSGGGQVAEELIEALLAEEDLPASSVQNVLQKMIGSLQDEDWDTEDETLERFKDVPVVVAAFRERGVELDADDGA